MSRFQQYLSQPSFGPLASRRTRSSAGVLILVISAALFSPVAASHAAPNFNTVDLACSYPAGTAPQVFLESFGGYSRTELLPQSGDDFDVAAGDFNGDLFLDLAFQNQNSSPRLRRVLNRGAISSGEQFDRAGESTTTLSRATQFSPMIVRDLNNDGVEDLIIPFQSGGTNGRGGTYRGTFDGSGNFTPVELPAACLQTQGNDLPSCVDGGNIPYGVETLAVAAATRVNTNFFHIATLQRAFRASAPTTTAQVFTYRPAAGGAIDPVGDGFYIPNDITAAAIAGGDLDGDGREDIAFATLPGNGVLVRFQTADGSFIPAARNLPVLSSSHVPVAMAVADLTLDGKNDLAILYDAPTGADYILVRTGLGNGLFSDQATRITVPSQPKMMVVKDLTADGKSDIFVLSASAGLILRNADGDFADFLRLSPDLSVSGVYPKSCAVGDLQHSATFTPDPTVGPNPGGGESNWGTLRGRRAKLTIKNRRLNIEMQRVIDARYRVRLTYRVGKKTFTRNIRSRTFRTSVRNLPRNTPIAVSYIFESTKNAALISRRSPTARKTIR